MFSLCNFSNKVKDGEAERAMQQLMSMNEPKSTVTLTKKSTRESLLKPNFRKPSTDQVLKKLPTKAVSKAKKVVNTQAIAHGRLNLLRALSKVKTEQVENKEELSKFYTERCRATLAEVGETETTVKLPRSDEDCSNESSYDGMEIEADPLKLPTRKRRSPNGLHSEESSDCDYMKKYPALPIEPPAKTEYNQEEFLGMFKLITPQVLESLKLRRSERKRRKCAKNQRTDYHYGNFDLNEVS